MISFLKRCIKRLARAWGFEKPKRRILVSVYDKSDLRMWERLAHDGWEFVSTGGTAIALKTAGIPCIDVAEVTGFPEMLDGRVKTLHPDIFGGILALRNKQAHLEALAKHLIDFIDVVVVNFYPFAQKPSIEEIDVGGPALARAAAKNGQYVAVVTDPADYPNVIGQLWRTKTIDVATRERLAEKVFRLTGEYDKSIANWMAEKRAKGEAVFASAGAARH